MRTVNLVVPRSWNELDNKQLYFVFLRLAVGDSSVELRTRCLAAWSGLHLVYRSSAKEAVFLLPPDEEEFVLSNVQIAEAIESLAWLDALPTFPVRLPKIGHHTAVNADFQGVPLSTFIACDNLYQGYLHTKNEDLLLRIAQMLYPSIGRSFLRKERPLGTLCPSEKINVFYWFASLKGFFARRFPHFFSPAGGSPEQTNLLDGSTSIGQKLQQAMDTQIRALTKGDITKESEVLAMDTWRALTELDAQAHEYEEMKRKFPNA